MENLIIKYFKQQHRMLGLIIRMSGLFMILGFLFVPVLYAYQIHPLTVDEEGNVVFTVDIKDAGSVHVTGSFNDWSTDKDPARKDERGLWTLSLKLLPGQYEYKIIADKKRWLPENNIGFSLVNENNKILLKGGDGFSARIDKRSNLKINENIYLKGLYKMILVNCISENKRNDSIVIRREDYRHLFHLVPEIYFNDNVFAEADLMLDTGRQVKALSLWKSHIDFYTDTISLVLYNNYKILSFNDPLHSLDRDFYIYSRYPVFNYPVSFYQEDPEETRLGWNNRGIMVQLRTFGFDLNSFYSAFTATEINYGGFTLKHDISLGHIGLAAVFKRNKLNSDSYINADTLESDWIKSPYTHTWYQLDDNTVFSAGDQVRSSKIGPYAHLNIIKDLGFFLEYLYEEKKGGYYAKTKTSDGWDLPINSRYYPKTSSGYHYSKTVHFYELPFKGQEFIIGIHLQQQKTWQQELSYRLHYLDFQNIDEYDNTKAVPKTYEIRSINKFLLKVDTIPISIGNEIKYLYGDTKIKGYNYHFLFDEYNYYKYYLDSCNKKLSVHNTMDFLLTGQLTLCHSVWWIQYNQNDIYFNGSADLRSQTMENILTLKYLFSACWELTGAVRAKQYDYKDYTGEDEIYSWRSRLYLNPFIQLKYYIYANFYLALAYGLDPVYDEEHKDGLLGYLYNNIDDRIPFFKTAEDRLQDQSFIGIKGELKF